MSRGRSRERVVVLQTDGRGNILDYDLVDRPSRTTIIEKPVSSSVRHSKASIKSPNASKGDQYEDGDNYEDDEYYDVQDSRANISFAGTSEEKQRQNSNRRGRSSVRRVRYVRPKSTVKIFQEAVDWYASPKVDARNDAAVEKILNAPKKQIYSEKPTWKGKPKIESHNEDVVDRILRAPKPEVQSII